MTGSLLRIEYSYSDEHNTTRGDSVAWMTIAFEQSYVFGSWKTCGDYLADSLARATVAGIRVCVARARVCTCTRYLRVVCRDPSTGNGKIVI